MKRKFTLLILIGIVCMSCSSKSRLSATNEEEKQFNGKDYTRISLQDSVINYGLQYMATPYRYGGTTPRGFDCSGFTSHVYRKFGYDLNRSSRDQAKQFPAVARKELQAGDLVFFEGRSHNGNVGHVGIVTEKNSNGEFKFIHASVNRGVTISSSQEPYYASRYLRAGRVVDKGNYLSLSRQNNSSDNNLALTNRNYSRKEQAASSKNMYDAVYHTVLKGENLAKISKDYDVPISTIQHLNGLKSKKIKKGQRLLISEAVNMPQMPIARIKSVHEEDLITPQQNEEEVKVFADNQPQQRKKAEPKKETNPVVAHQNKPQPVPVEASVQKTPQEKTEVRIAELRIPKEEPVVQTNTQTTGIHRVTAGETLYGVARKYNLSVDEIKQLNNLNSNTINAGQQLIVSRNESKVQEVHVPKQEASPSERIITHTVEHGETLYSIARKYQCSVSEIRTWNPNLSDRIQVGNKIKIEKK